MELVVPPVGGEPFFNTKHHKSNIIQLKQWVVSCTQFSCEFLFCSNFVCSHESSAHNLYIILRMGSELKHKTKFLHCGDNLKDGLSANLDEIFFVINSIRW
ncbi:MAG: hypothetical protein QGF10_00715, partial [Alphaproteobacteria bacterium]|nr:hypothetical protein [Alphaproteobacteria bacterium]